MCQTVHDESKSANDSNLVSQTGGEVVNAKGHAPGLHHTDWDDGEVVTSVSIDHRTDEGMSGRRKPALRRAAQADRHASIRCRTNSGVRE